MNNNALTEKEVIRLTTEGVAEMRGLLLPSQCKLLLPPTDIDWVIEEATGVEGRSWSHTPEYRFGAQAEAVSPPLQSFLGDFRAMVQSRGSAVPELRTWGDTKFGDYPAELFGFQRLVYGARWHRTAANHQIGWHSDDTFHEARKEVKGEFGIRALGIMVAISLTEHGGAYEFAPAAAVLNEDGSPRHASDVQRIEGIGRGDAVAFCTARNSMGENWPGSFPRHRFIADELGPNASAGAHRDSLVVYFRDVSERTFADIGLAGIVAGVKAKLLGKLAS